MPRILLGEVAREALGVLLHGRRIGIERLRDISQSGLSFFINQPIAVSEKIAIAYSDAHVNVEVFGRVAWCKRTQLSDDASMAGSYLMGVELLSPMMLYAVLPKA